MDEISKVIESYTHSEEVGRGRGNWGHEGRPGKVGGSAPAASAQYLKSHPEEAPFIVAGLRVQDGNSVIGNRGLLKRGAASGMPTFSGRVGDRYAYVSHPSSGVGWDRQRFEVGTWVVGPPGRGTQPLKMTFSDVLEAVKHAEEYLSGD